MQPDEPTVALARKMTAKDFAERYGHRTFMYGDETCVFHEGMTYRWRTHHDKSVRYYGWWVGKLPEGEVVSVPVTWSYRAPKKPKDEAAEEPEE